MIEETGDNLADAGAVLFGSRWQSDLARALGTSDRMIRYWLAGSHNRPVDLNDRLISLLEQRVGRTQEMIGRLRTAGRGENEK